MVLYSFCSFACMHVESRFIPWTKKDFEVGTEVWNNLILIDLWGLDEYKLIGISYLSLGNLCFPNLKMVKVGLLSGSLQRKHLKTGKKNGVLSSPPPNSCWTGQSPAGLLRTLPNSAQLCQALPSLAGLGQSLAGFLLN